MRAGRRRERFAQLDQAVAVDAEQALVEGLHAVVLALGDDVLDLVRLVGVHDLVEDPAGRDEDLDRGDAAAVAALDQLDRQRIQAALAALGFPTGRSDGYLGPRSREMIAAWQKNTGGAATGYLTAEAQAALLRDAAPAIARQEEEQRRLAAAQPPVQPPAQAQPPARQQPPPAAPAKVVTSSATALTGPNGAAAPTRDSPASCWSANTTITNGVISGSWTSQATAEVQSFAGNIDAAGNVHVTYSGIGTQTNVNRRFTALMTGRIEGNVLSIAGRAGPNGRDFSATIQCR